MRPLPTHRRVERLASVRRARHRIAQQPDSARAHADLAWALVQAYDPRLRGRHAVDADAAARAALRLAPDEAWAHHTAGRVALARRDAAGAAAAFRRGLALAPMAAELHNDLGVALQEMGLKREAVQAYGTASQIDPEDSLPHDNARGAVAVKVGFLAMAFVQVARLVLVEHLRWFRSGSLWPLVLVVAAVAVVVSGRELRLRARRRALGLPRADPEVMRRLRRAERRETLRMGLIGKVALTGWALTIVVVAAALILA